MDLCRCQSLLGLFCFVYKNTGGVHEACVATSDPNVCGRGYTTFATAETCCDRFAEGSTAPKCVELALESAVGLGCPINEATAGSYCILCF